MSDIDIYCGPIDNSDPNCTCAPECPDPECRIHPELPQEGTQ